MLRKPVKKIMVFKIVTFLLLILLSGCFSASVQVGEVEKKAENESRLNHIVLCWLKEPGNPQNISKIIRMTQSFEKIPGVLEARAGVVVPSDRKVVDDSFDIGILIVVRDQDALQEYLDHPIHQKAKEETLLPLVERVLVYDFRG